MKEFTRKELSTYNGKNGKPAYVAIEGKVYDVTPIKGWVGGRHHGHLAGNNLTKELLHKSPHGAKVLSKLEVVGKLID